MYNIIIRMCVSVCKCMCVHMVANMSLCILYYHNIIMMHL